mgnify:FL=1
MQLVCGTIRGFSEENRIFEIRDKNRVKFYYLSRSQYKRFKPYLNEGLVVHFTCKETRTNQSGFLVYEVVHFIKMLRHLPRKTIVYYDISTIKQGVKKIFSRDGYRLFLDLEFSMPPYGYVHGNGFVSEIIEYGLYLEDNEGNLITTEWGMIKPRHEIGINSRTIEFLKISENDLRYAPSPYKFYKKFKTLLTAYQPTIYVWGKNDISMLDSFYKENKFVKLAERKNFINLMQVIKNYYGIKTDIGLFNAYEFFNVKQPKEQDHNALNDAVATADIFKLFQKELNTDTIE